MRFVNKVVAKLFPAQAGVIPVDTANNAWDETVPRASGGDPQLMPIVTA